MKKTISLTFLFICILQFTSCIKENPEVVVIEEEIAPPYDSIKQLSEANQIFGWNLLKQESINKPDENVTISPLSLQLTFNMATNAAQGSTLEEIKEVLHCKDYDQQSINDQSKLLTQYLINQNGHPVLSLSNGFFYDHNKLILNNEFQKRLEGYKCRFEKSDFTKTEKTLKLINGWVKEKTNDKIDKILNNITDQDIAFLINALYFKSDWAIGFSPKQIVKQNFTNSKGFQKNVDFLISDRNTYFFKNKNTMIADLPFKDSTFSLSLLRIDGQTGIGDLNKEIYSQFLQKMKYERAKIAFPKIRIIYENDLIPSLTSLGMISAFSGKDADFILLGQTSKNIFITQVKHKIKLDIDEKGADGAAVTSIGFGLDSQPPVLLFDKPFYIVLRHIESNTIVFTGIINKI